MPRILRLLRNQRGIERLVPARIPRVDVLRGLAGVCLAPLSRVLDFASRRARGEGNEGVRGAALGWTAAGAVRGRLGRRGIAVRSGWH
jgi:hypothetical protein